MIVVNVTHEAVDKIGGIGAVIAGLMTADAYAEQVSRTILLGPLLSTDCPVNRRLGESGRVIYSSLDAVQGPPWHEKFHPIEKTYDVGIVYGHRKVADPCSGGEVEAEVLLVDVFHSNKDRLNLFKAELFSKFSVPSVPFEQTWEYEQYVRLAEPGCEALKAIGADGTNSDGEPVVILAHEYMGMPTALRSVLAGSPNTRTVFYAHEVASVRPIVETMPGHDTMFYNVLELSKQNECRFEDVFPSAKDNYKHALVKAARYCDCVFAVGDYVVEELRFIDPHFRTMEIDLVYNGLPVMPITLNEANASHSRMRQYAENLFGNRPDWILTHVARPVLSKGIWRDLRVLHEMDALLQSRGESAVYFMLGTLAGQRRPQDICHMEKVYNWPVSHERGYPDLCQGEEVLGDIFSEFNRNHKATHAVLVNQWDWNRNACGQRMPEEMVFADIRRGTDVEFGMSVYEPFGISQLEPLSFGALCVVSSVCGCTGFVQRASLGNDISNNVIVGDFLHLTTGPGSLDEMKNLPSSRREELEAAEGERLAYAIVERLARDEATRQSRIQAGYELASKMDWERVVTEYFLPSLAGAAIRQ